MFSALDFIPGVKQMGQLGGAAANGAGKLFDGLYDHSPTPMDPKDAGQAINSQHRSDQEISDADPNPNELIGKLDTKDQRLAALSKVSENDIANEQSQSYCGPAALLAASMYGKGGKGVEMMMSQIDSDAAKADKEAKPDAEMAALKKRLDAPGAQLNQADMQMKWRKLYDSMRAAQNADPNVSDANKNEAGINGAAMQDYIQGHPAMAKMMQDNHESVSFIDSTGGGNLDHYVLDINKPSKKTGGDGANTVYDPFSRKGGQVVTDPDQVNAYNSTKHVNFDGS